MASRKPSPGFEPFDAKMRAEGLPEIAIRTFRYYYEQLLSGDRGTLSRDEIDPVDEVSSSEALAGSGEAARAALSRAVVIKLNGGLGTSMGMTRAKSLLTVKGDLTFLDLICRQILHLREQFDCRIPLLLMNSFRTRADSLAVLSRYGDLGAGLGADFLQHKVPRIRADDLAPVEWPEAPELEWCPPGHGDIYTALLTSGMLEKLLERGYRYAFVSNSDNLGAVLDLDILGWFASEGAPFAMEVKDRTEADRKGGHLAKTKQGGLTLREIAQCPPEERESFEDVRLYRYFNTNNLWVNLESLRDALAERDSVLGLPMIRNDKTVDPNDASSPAVIQLETAMGAAISVFPDARAVRVPAHRFAPVKTTNDLMRIWSDAYVLSSDHRILPAPDGFAEDLVIDLDPAFYKRIDDFVERLPHGAPSLLRCRRLSVRGDFRFGKGVSISGEVDLRSEDGAPRRIADGEALP
jgi:UTP--glucose-1-phosphate uridylyltransferase